ncbi:MAG: hypothetical protein LAT54_02600 [Cryomorphaceae bacterium]|nr:hypothetical protein [Cryomorphaceae bacterium]
MNSSLNILATFVLGILLQVLVLNNVQLFGFMVPYYYPIIILALPATMNQHYILIFAALTGFIIDMFEHTGALHASATLIMAYLRPVILRLISTQSGRELPELSLQALGIKNFLLLSSIGIFVHHFSLFFVDALRFSNIDITFIRALYSTLLSVVVVFVVHGLFTPLRKKI